MLGESRQAYWDHRLEPLGPHTRHGRPGYYENGQPIWGRETFGGRLLRGLGLLAAGSTGVALLPMFWPVGAGLIIWGGLDTIVACTDTLQAGTLAWSMNQARIAEHNGIVALERGDHRTAARAFTEAVHRHRQHCRLASLLPSHLAGEWSHPDDRSDEWAPVLDAVGRLLRHGTTAPHHLDRAESLAHYAWRAVGNSRRADRLIMAQRRRLPKDLRARYTERQQDRLCLGLMLTTVGRSIGARGLVAAGMEALIEAQALLQSIGDEEYLPGVMLEMEALRQRPAPTTPSADLSLARPAVAVDPASPDLTGVAEDMRAMLQSGAYHVVVRELDGERFLFPNVLPTEIVVTPRSPAPVASAGRWRDVVIPTALHSGEQGWEPTDDFILHLQRTISPPDPENYVGRFSYHPLSQEFLPGTITVRHHQTVQRFGSHPFNSYVRGIYVRTQRILLLRCYFNPLTPDDRFNPYGYYDPAIDQEMTTRTLQMLMRNGLPRDLKVVAYVASNEVVQRYTGFV